MQDIRRFHEAFYFGNAWEKEEGLDYYRQLILEDTDAENDEETEDFEEPPVEDDGLRI